MRPEGQRESLVPWALAALTLAGAALRFHGLGDKSLWYDEASTWALVQGTLAQVLALNATDNSAPPLYPLLLALVTGPGATEAALRAPAALASVLAIPAAWRLAREFLTGWQALFVALLVAIAPAQVEYAQQVREYSMSYLVACLVLLAGKRFMDAPSGARAAALAAAGALGLCVQYGIAILVGGVGLACLAAVPRAPDPRRAFLQLAGAGAAVGATGAVLLVTTIRTQLAAVTMGTAGYLAPHYWDHTAAGLLRLAASRHAASPDIVHFSFPGKLMFALVAAGALAGLWRREWRAATLLAALPAGLTFAAALAGAYPFGGIRQDFFLVPMLHVCAGIGLALVTGALARRWGPPAAAAAALAVTAALALTGGAATARLLRDPGSEPMRPVVAELAQRLDPGERIYVYWGAVPAFRYYWRDRPEPWIRGAVHWSGLGAERSAAGLGAVQAELVALAADPAPYWLVLSHVDEDEAVAMLEPLRARAAVNVVKALNGSVLLRVTPRGARP